MLYLKYLNPFSYYNKILFTNDFVCFQPRLCTFVDKYTINTYFSLEIHPTTFKSSALTMFELSLINVHEYYKKNAAYV